MMSWNILLHYISWTADSAAKIAQADTYKTSLISELDSGVATYYSAIAYRLK